MAKRSGRKVIITCAVTGSIHTPTMSPHLPVTSEQILESAVGAAEAGAAILHLHARDSSDGRPSPSPEAFLEFLPALRDRTDDIPLLIEHFVRHFAKRHDHAVRNVSLAARRRLLSFSWPGNVRQLRNAIESMVVVDADGVLDLDDLPEELADSAQTAPPPAAGNSLGALVGRSMDEVERLFISETLRFTGGNREEAAKLLQIGERTLYRKIKEFGL